jgi:vancomycin resistance protein VanJ
MTPGDPPDSGSGPPDRGRPSRGARLVGVGGWICLALAVGAWALLRAGDVWTLATVLMFGPLPLLALPPAALAAAAAFVNRRALKSLAPALILTVGPVSGFCVPWEQLGADVPAGLRLRVLTCNMHHAKVPAGPLDRLIDETGPDVVAIQEWRDSARSKALAEAGWHTHRDPGLFLASRHPIRRAGRLGDNSTGDRGSIARYELDTPSGPATVFSLHFASPRDGLGEVAKGGGDLERLAANSELRWVQSRYLAAAADGTAGPVVLLGDFNTPPHSAIFRRVWGRYEDAFSVAGWGWGYTFKARISSVRIDHVLVGAGGRATRCWVGPDVGSPHRPVLADLAWPDNAGP